MISPGSSPTDPLDRAWFVIMAGGRGTRFWPLSRRRRPKQVLALAGEQSLLCQTIERLLPLAPPERILVITGPDMVEAVAAEAARLPVENLLVEPSGRNTAPCIGWATVEIERRAGPDALIAVLPSDQRVDRPEVLRAALRLALAEAQGGERILTLGIRPRHPETGFGYLELGPRLAEEGELGLYPVQRFQEKPDRARAEAWVADGRHLWNAGMFAFSARTMRAAFRQHLPRSAAALDQLAEQPDRLAEVWPELEATSIDYGVMERHAEILTVACDPGWSDVGAWPAVVESLPEAPGGRGRGKGIIAVRARGNAVLAPERLVALVGVEGLVVVDTPDALLVMALDAAQELREVLAELERRGLDALT